MLSVITITFNNFTELKSTINSLPDLDIQSVIVNGGKCQETKEFLAHSEALSVSEKDKGISDAFNKGFHLATGEFITYLNSGDVLIDEKYYEEAIEVLSNDPLIGFVYADICFVDPYAGKIHVRSGHPLPNMPYMHPTLILRKSVMEKIGLFNLEYKIAMDLDFVYRLIKTDAKGFYIPRMVVEMDGSGVSSHNHVRAFKEKIHIIKNNHDYSLRSLVFVIKGGICLLGKMILLKLGLENILKAYREKRYKIRS